jgi:RimJ/RimL family protein N-acetyltransferase
MNPVRMETKNLILRPPVEADLAGWAALDADPGATRFIGGQRCRAQSWLGLATAAGMWSLRGYGLFSVLRKADGRWIGRVGPWVPEGAIGTEIGWALGRDFWGAGYAAEAATAAIGWAFDQLGWTDVIHCIDGDNVASIKLALKLGSAWQREHRDADGRPVQIHGQSRESWRARVTARG